MKRIPDNTWLGIALSKRPRKSLARAYPKIAQQWHPDRNGSLKPCHVSSNSPRIAWWKMPDGHEFQARINNRASSKGCCVVCLFNSHVDWSAIDWSKSDEQVAKETGKGKPHVGFQRRRYNDPDSAKERNALKRLYPVWTIDWNLDDDAVAAMLKTTIDVARRLRRDYCQA